MYRMVQVLKSMQAFVELINRDCEGTTLDSYMAEYKETSQQLLNAYSLLMEDIEHVEPMGNTIDSRHAPHIVVPANGVSVPTEERPADYGFLDPEPTDPDDTEY